MQKIEGNMGTYNPPPGRGSKKVAQISSGSTRPGTEPMISCLAVSDLTYCAELIHVNFYDDISVSFVLDIASQAVRNKP